MGGRRWQATQSASARSALRLPDGRDLLRSVSVEVAAGEIIAFLGRSGSGKTTLLRTVNALVQPTSGEVLVGGTSVQASDAIALRRSIGYVIQETGLFPHMTVARNVAISAELAGAAGRTAGKRVDEVLEQAGLRGAEFRERYPWQLSGGQRQRVGLARAMMSDPEILLMDEPFGALDPITRTEVQDTVHDLLQRMPKTVLMVTHDLEEALYLADRVLFLEAGQVVADLPVAAVRRSEHPVVRQYVAAVRHGATA